MKNLLLILLATFMSFNTMVAQDKGYKIGLWGAYNQHPVVEMNKQTTDGYKYVKSSQFIPTGKIHPLMNKQYTGFVWECLLHNTPIVLITI